MRTGRLAIIKLATLSISEYIESGQKESKCMLCNDRLFQAPRCKKCNHNDPEYKVASSPPHNDGIKLKCVYCGDISVKD